LPIHLDVNVPDRQAELERLLGLGGRLVETKSRRVGEIEETCTVMRDPEGNGFCIQAPANALPNRYLGNVTFSCARPIPLGRFWANALGWPDDPIDEGFLQTLLAAGMDERELESFYVTRNPDGSRPRFLFQRREKSRPEFYPIHLDFLSGDRESELERLTGAGAFVVETRCRHLVIVTQAPMTLAEESPEPVELAALERSGRVAHALILRRNVTNARGGACRELPLPFRVTRVLQRMLFARGDDEDGEI